MSLYNKAWMKEAVQLANKLQKNNVYLEFMQEQI